MNNYLKENITNMINIILANCNVIAGNKPFEKDLIKDIVSIQYHSLNKTLFIETETYNYVIEESGAIIRISEFFKTGDICKRSE